MGSVGAFDVKFALSLPLHACPYSADAQGAGRNKNPAAATRQRGGGERELEGKVRLNSCLPQGLLTICLTRPVTPEPSGPVSGGCPASLARRWQAFPTHHPLLRQGRFPGSAAGIASHMDTYRSSWPSGHDNFTRFFCFFGHRGPKTAIFWGDFRLAVGKNPCGDWPSGRATGADGRSNRLGGF